MVKLIKWNDYCVYGLSVSLESVFWALAMISRTWRPPSTRIYIYNESLFLVKPLKHNHAVSTGSFIQLRQMEKF